MMCHPEAPQPLHGAPPAQSRQHRSECAACKAADSSHGSYSQAMPTDQGPDAERLQAVLLGSYKQREPSPTTLALDGFMRVVDWFGRIWSTCLSMMGVKRLATTPNARTSNPTSANPSARTSSRFA